LFDRLYSATLIFDDGNWEVRSHNNWVNLDLSDGVRAIKVTVVIDLQEGELLAVYHGGCVILNDSQLVPYRKFFSKITKIEELYQQSIYTRSECYSNINNIKATMRCCCKVNFSKIVIVGKSMLDVLEYAIDSTGETQNLGFLIKISAVSYLKPN